MKVGDKVKALTGWREGRVGKIEAIGDTEIPIGVRFPADSMLVWYRENQIVIVKD